MTSLLRALRLTFALWLLTVVVITAPLLGVARLVAPEQAAGSLLRHQGQVVGSSLIGQPFESPRYLHGRPSAVDGATGPVPNSGASNLSVANPRLRDQVQARVAAWQRRGVARPAADLLTSSGSGLDPHISLEAALQQAPAIAQARGLSEAVVAARLRACARSPLPGWPLAAWPLRPLVAVLPCNLALDQAER